MFYVLLCLLLPNEFSHGDKNEVVMHLLRLIVILPYWGKGSV